MSIQTLRTLAQLKQECVSLGLNPIIRGKKERKDDYILALRDYHIKRKYPNGKPLSLDLMLSIESPMLCQQYKILKKEEQDAIWSSNNWYLEEKEDGIRLPLIYTNKEFDFFSRNISVDDYLPISYKDNIYLGNIDKSKITDNFILDCEVVSTNSNISTIMGNKGVVTETQLQAVSALLALESSESIRVQKEEDVPLQFKVFDCLWFNGDWIIDKPLIERRKYMKKALLQLQSAGLNCKTPKSNISNKKAFYKYIIDRGGEGCFKSDQRVLMSDYSYKTIKDIEIGDKVLSYNHNLNKVEVKTVTNKFFNGYKHISEWGISSYKDTSLIKIISTNNHKFYSKDSYKRCDSISTCYMLDNVMDSYRKQVILSFMLLDRCIKDKNISYLIQEEGNNLDFILDLFNDFIIDKFNMSIPNKYIKCLDKYSIKDINEIGLAYLFMLCGSCSNKVISLYIDSHNLVEHLNNRFNIKSSLIKDNISSETYIKIDIKDNINFINIISPYIHPSVRYKISKYDLKDYIIPSKVEKNLVEVDLTRQSILEYNNNSNDVIDAWDLEVEDNHNYFVEEVLVHNCVAKNLYSPYISTSSRRRDGFVKIKRTMSESLRFEGLADTVDGWISGFEPADDTKSWKGLVGALEISLYLKDTEGNLKEHKIAKVANIPMDLRKEMTDYDENNNPILKKEYYGKVVEIDGQAVSARERRLKHAILIRFRSDRSMDTCIMSEEFLEKMIL